MCETDRSTVLCRIFVQEDNYNFRQHYRFVIFLLFLYPACESCSFVVSVFLLSWEFSFSL